MAKRVRNQLVGHELKIFDELSAKPGVVPVISHRHA
jgi:hypothetical protein